MKQALLAAAVLLVTPRAGLRSSSESGALSRESLKERCALVAAVLDAPASRRFDFPFLKSQCVQDLLPAGVPVPVLVGLDWLEGSHLRGANVIRSGESCQWKGAETFRKSNDLEKPATIVRGLMVHLRPSSDGRFLYDIRIARLSGNQSNVSVASVCGFATGCVFREGSGWKSLPGECRKDSVHRPGGRPR